MADIIQLDISPSAAILNSLDTYLPEKTREVGVQQPYFSLKFPSDNETRAFWSWPVPKQNDLGVLSGTGNIVLRWSVDSTDVGNVGWFVSVSEVLAGEDVDKVFLGDVTSPVTAYAGAANKEHITIIPMSSLFAALPVNETARFVLQVRRDVSVAGNLARTVRLLKSEFIIDFTTKLEANGPIERTIVKDTPTEVLLTSEFGAHIVCDTATAGGAMDVYLPSDVSAVPLAASNDGMSFLISRIGAHDVNVYVDPGGGGPATAILGTLVIPTVLTVDGDCLRFTYSEASQAYQIQNPVIKENLLTAAEKASVPTTDQKASFPSGASLSNRLALYSETIKGSVYEDDLSTISADWSFIVNPNSSVAIVGGRMRFTKDAGVIIGTQATLTAPTMFSLPVTVECYIKNLSAANSTGGIMRLVAAGDITKYVGVGIIQAPSGALEVWFEANGGPLSYYNIGVSEGWVRLTNFGTHCKVSWSNNTETTRPTESDWTELGASITTHAATKWLCPSQAYFEVSWGTTNAQIVDFSNLKLQYGVEYI